MATAKKAAKRTAKKTPKGKVTHPKDYRGIHVTMTFCLDYPGGINRLPSNLNVGDIIENGISGSPLLPGGVVADLLPGARLSMKLR